MSSPSLRSGAVPRSGLSAWLVVVLAVVLAVGLTACEATGTTTPPTSPPVVAEGWDNPDCSATHLSMDDPVLQGLPVEAHSTAQYLYGSARACDQKLLLMAARDGGTRFTFGNADANEFLALPEGNTPVYEIIARLIGGTTFAQAGANLWVWPAVAAGGGTDADWQTLVSSGLYTQDEADALRAAGEGYLGWRLGIETQGSWSFLVAGD